MSVDHQDATRPGVIETLCRWYVVDEGQARTLVNEYEEIVSKGIAFRSHNFYVADQIGEAANLPEREGVEEEDDDEDDEF